MYKYNPFSGTLDITNSSTKSVINTLILPTTFDANYIVGTEASPVSSNITFTSGTAGYYWKVFHNSANIPTFPLNVLYIKGNYVRNVLNVIDMYYDGTNILISISQVNNELIPSLTNGYKYIANTPPQFGNTINSGTGSSNISSGSVLGIQEELSITAVNDARGRQSSSTSFLIPELQDWVADFTFRVKVLSNATDRYILFAGLASTTSTPYSANDSVGIIYSDDINAGNLQLRISKTSSDNNVIDLGVPVAANGVYEVVLYYVLNDSLKVWINNVFIGSYGITNMPDGLTKNMVTITKTVGTNLIQPVDNGTFNLGV